MNPKTVLDIVGPYGKDGWQNEDGVEFYNDRVTTPHGLLGRLKTRLADGELVIDVADPIVLIRKGFPEDWTATTVGASMEQSPFGFFIFQLDARNGMVRYRILDDELAWGELPGGAKQDTPDLDVYSLGMLTYSAWTEEGEAPPRIRNTIDTFSSTELGKKGFKL